MSALVELHPDQLRQPDSKKALPLHYACDADYYGYVRVQSHEIIKMLLEAYFAAAETRGDNYRTPLYWALEKGASAEIIKILLDAFSAAAEVKDRNSRTPLY